MNLIGGFYLSFAGSYFFTQAVIFLLSRLFFYSGSYIFTQAVIFYSGSYFFTQAVIFLRMQLLID